MEHNKKIKIWFIIFLVTLSIGTGVTIIMSKKTTLFKGEVVAMPGPGSIMQAPEAEPPQIPYVEGQAQAPPVGQIVQNPETEPQAPGVNVASCEDTPADACAGLSQCYLSSQNTCGTIPSLEVSVDSNFKPQPQLVAGAVDVKLASFVIKNTAPQDTELSSAAISALTFQNQTGDTKPLFDFLYLKIGSQTPPNMTVEAQVNGMVKMSQPSQNILSVAAGQSAVVSLMGTVSKDIQDNKSFQFSIARDGVSAAFLSKDGTTTYTAQIAAPGGAVLPAKTPESILISQDAFAKTNTLDVQENPDNKNTAASVEPAAIGIDLGEFSLAPTGKPVFFGFDFSYAGKDALKNVVLFHNGAKFAENPTVSFDSGTTTLHFSFVLVISDSPKVHNFGLSGDISDQAVPGKLQVALDSIIVTDPDNKKVSTIKDNSFPFPLRSLTMKGKEPQMKKEPSKVIAATTKMNVANQLPAGQKAAISSGANATVTPMQIDVKVTGDNSSKPHSIVELQLKYLGTLDPKKITNVHLLAAGGAVFPDSDVSNLTPDANGDIDATITDMSGQKLNSFMDTLSLGVRVDANTSADDAGKTIQYEILKVAISPEDYDAGSLNTTGPSLVVAEQKAEIKIVQKKLALAEDTGNTSSSSSTQNKTKSPLAVVSVQSALAQEQKNSADNVSSQKKTSLVSTLTNMRGAACASCGTRRNSAAPSLVKSKKLRYAPEQGKTGPEPLLYGIFVAAANGIFWLKRKRTNTFFNIASAPAYRTGRQREREGPK